MNSAIILKGITIEECVDEVKLIYADSEVCIYELLENIKAINLTIPQQVKLFGVIMYDIEDDYLVRGNVDENWSEDMY